MAAELVLGPMLRRIEDTAAAVWVQTSAAAAVRWWQRRAGSRLSA
ncbi:hypothetical protein [Georgenia sunbinii]